MDITNKQRDTILAALRYWQRTLADAANEIDQEILAIAFNNRIGEDAILNIKEIDDLCEELNTKTRKGAPT